MDPQFSLETLRFYLSGNPWLRLLLPFGSGIALALRIPPGKAFFYQEMYGLLIFLFLAYLLTRYNKHGLALRTWIPGSIGLLFLLCMGFQLTRAHISLHSGAHFSRQSWSALYVQVHSIPENRGKFIRFEARVLLGKPETARPIKKTKGQLLIYLQSGKAPAYGDELWIAADFQKVPAPRNPAAFDFKAYLSAKDIYHQAFLSEDQCLFSGRSSGSPLIKWAAGLQKKCVNIIEGLFQNQENAALLSAFVLGYRAGIDRDTMNAFAATGTIHILSVSGMHVAILYWLINFLLRPLGLLRGGKVLQLLLTICSISFYALLTGLSPPVCRAAWMIILYVIATFLNRQHKAGNTLALTAFLLLASDPLVLADVGFQLSFLAVAGLIFFYPPLAGLYSPNQAWLSANQGPAKNKRRMYRLWQLFLKHVWSMTAVSLTAQLTTFPLAVYYFHQFPVYFLPANLVLIPLASLILYGGILLLLISGTGAAAIFLAKQLSLLIDIMKSGMHFFSELPGAVLDGLWITPAECTGMYLLILAGAFFLLFRKASGLIATLCISLCLACSFVIENYRQARQRLLVYFHLKETPAIGFLAGKSAVLLLKAPYDEQDYAYSVQPFLDRSGIADLHTIAPPHDTRTAFLAKKRAYLQFFDLRILVVGKNFIYPRLAGKPLPCDLLLITENTYLQMEKLSKAFHIKMLVSGGGISSDLNNFLETWCRRRNIPFYSIRRSGAFVMRLRETRQAEAAQHRERKPSGSRAAPGTEAEQVSPNG